MKIRKLIFFFCIGLNLLLTTGCGRSENPAAVRERLDDEALQFIATEFPMFASNHGDSTDFKEQKLSNADNPEFIIYPGQYKLKYYVVSNPFHYKPFAVQVTDSDNNVITHFSFRDEVHYMHDGLRYSVDGDSVKIRRHEVRPSQQTAPDMEKNLNDLVRKLNYEKDESAIFRLIDMISTMCYT